MIELEQTHNENTKKYFQKLLLFIDATILNASNASEEKNKILLTSLLNIKDSIFSEVVRDNYTLQLNNMIIKNKRDLELSKKNELSEKEKDIDQEIELEKDQLG